MQVVLYEPEIPQNAGNIARLCAATGLPLHLIRPLGFIWNDKYVKRAGLDYWDMVEIHFWDGFDELKKAYPESVFYLLTTKGGKRYTDVRYAAADFLVFGPESRGLPASVLQADPERCLRVPMVEGARSLNLANTVALVAYEALRQLGFPGMV